MVLIASLALLVGGAYVPGNWGEYVPAVMLQVGSALLLVPPIMWMERQLSRRVDRLERNLTRAERDASAIGQIRLDAEWQEAFPAIRRAGLMHSMSAIVVKPVDVELWIGFSTFDDATSGADGSMVWFQFTDPALSEKSALDGAVQWTEGMTAVTMLKSLTVLIRRHKAGAIDFDHKEVIDKLRERITELVQ